MTRYLATLLLILSTTVIHRTITHVQAVNAMTSKAPALIDLPDRILAFTKTGEDSPASESVREILETNTILARTYTSPVGEPVQLMIVYAENTRRSLHFPEVCFTGQGWETHGKSSIPIGTLFIGQRLTLQKGDVRQAVVYWFKTGDTSTGSYFVNSYIWARDKLLMKDPSAMLVRLSTPIGIQGEEEAYRVLNEFASGLAPVLLDAAP